MIISRKKIIRLIIPVFFTSVILINNSCRHDHSFQESDLTTNDTATRVFLIPPPTYLGIDTSEYRIVSGRIHSGEFLSDILDNYGITYQQIDLLTRNSAGVFDPREMKAGTSYKLLFEKGDSERIAFMIYEQDQVNRAILHFEDSLYITHVALETRSDLKYASGTIETSLWNSVVESGFDPMLAVELSEIYAWSIDFFTLQKGDKYKIIYEENYIDNKPLGIRKIYGAWFRHSGTEFYAIPFIQDSSESFFDREGNSLRKAFLKAPLRYSRISSRFSSSRMHPILRIRRPHYGVDYAAPTGTPVEAIGDGRVIMAEYQNESGRIVKIRHNSVYTTAYMHLSRYGKGIRPGVYVKQGDIIGYVGSSGLATGPHLDFRFYKNGDPVDPLKVEAPSVDPVSEENRAKFQKISKVVVTLLDSF